MNPVPDPVADGLSRGWKVFGGPHGALPKVLDCDVAIVGSGAGAGISAELLTAAGLSVVIVEEGPLSRNRTEGERRHAAAPTGLSWKPSAVARRFNAATLRWRCCSS
ncbi:MAG: hypothetical protein KIS83_04715 [Rubrivivax sp.]|nr:hypothetical protein [Rubrivivax sp.]